MMKTIHTTVDQAMLEDLDQTVEQLQTTRSSFIRELLQVALRRRKISLMEKQQAAAYVAQPPDETELAEWLAVQDWGEEWDQTLWSDK